MYRMPLVPRLPFVGYGPLGPKGRGIVGTAVPAGEMSRLIRAKDWSKTALGPIESWPQSLRTVVSLMQASSSPVSLVWGPGHVQIYNDGYRAICGDRHPTSMGQDFRECWAVLWPAIRDAYETAWTGKTSHLENACMFLARDGSTEGTWLTFSSSPITGADSVEFLAHAAQRLWDQAGRARTSLPRTCSVGDAQAGRAHRRCFGTVAHWSGAAVEIAPGLVARGDARLMTIALENLLGNAWKFTAKHEHASVAVGRRDNGVDSEFQRLHKACEFEGAGIGLATVQRIISRHGGRIWAEAAIDQGATFFFVLGGKP